MTLLCVTIGCSSSSFDVPNVSDSIVEDVRSDAIDIGLEVEASSDASDAPPTDLGVCYRRTVDDPNCGANDPHMPHAWRCERDAEIGELVMLDATRVCRATFRDDPNATRTHVVCCPDGAS